MIYGIFGITAIVSLYFGYKFGIYVSSCVIVDALKLVDERSQRTIIEFMNNPSKVYK